MRLRILFSRFLFVAFLVALAVLVFQKPTAAQQTGRFVLDEVMLLNVTTGNAVKQLNSIRELLIIVECGASVTAGGVQLEEAYLSTYTLTWELLGAEAVCNEADSTRTIHVQEMYLRAIRMRVSTTIVGGTVTVRLTGQ